MKTIVATFVGLVAAASISAAAGPRQQIMEGNPAAQVKVVIFEDLQCADCTNFRRMLDEKLLPRYGSKVLFVHRDFPLAKHSWARQAAVAGRWVYEQNHELGILFRQQIMAEQSNIAPENFQKWLLEFAARTNLDQKGILDSLKDPRLVNLVEQDFQSGIARGVSKTPTIFVNSISFVELIIFDDLARTIDQALAK